MAAMSDCLELKQVLRVVDSAREAEAVNLGGSWMGLLLGAPSQTPGSSNRQVAWPMDHGEILCTVKTSTVKMVRTMSSD